MSFDTRYESEYGLLWGLFNPGPVPKMTVDLLSDINAHDEELIQFKGHRDMGECFQPVHFYVWASSTESVFNLGGDLQFFVRCIREQNRPALMQYAVDCIDCIHRRVTHYDLTDLITITLVQGDALGGGFEAALAADVIIAEERARFGFPEIRFNSFPGMGAYSLLSRKVGRGLAERMMLSGDRFCAKAMFDAGVVDVLVPTGEGREAVREYVAVTSSRRIGTACVYRARQAMAPVLREELMVITTQWVDAALQLQSADLRLMEQLVHRQSKMRSPT